MDILNPNIRIENLQPLNTMKKYCTQILELKIFILLNLKLDSCSVFGLKIFNPYGTLDNIVNSIYFAKSLKKSKIL